MGLEDISTISSVDKAIGGDSISCNCLSIEPKTDGTQHFDGSSTQTLAGSSSVLTGLLPLRPLGGSTGPAS